MATPSEVKQAVRSFIKTGIPSWEEVLKLAGEAEYINQAKFSIYEDVYRHPDSMQGIAGVWGLTVDQQHELMGIMRQHVKTTIEIEDE